MKLNKEPTAEEITAELSGIIHMRIWDELVFCGFGEPTERLDVLLDIVRWVRKHYGRRLIIRVDTNGHGYRLNQGRDVVLELKEAGVDKVSVSLNAGDKETYNEICKPTFPSAYEEVLEFIQKASSRMDVEVSVVRLPEVDLTKAEAVANKLGVKFKVREYIACFY